MSIKIAVIPDVQSKDGVRQDHLTWAGKYFAEKRPDVIVNLCDFYDMSSLSSYDTGKKSYEGRRYSKDIDAGDRGLDLLHNPIAKARNYKPKLFATLGNHEHRIEVAVESDPKLEGTIGLDDLSFKEHGYKVYGFLQPVKIAGFTFAHYFPSGPKGLPCSSARALVSKYHKSCIAGHQQGLDWVMPYLPGGERIICMIAGSFYQHKEHYLNPMTNRHWRGVIMLHEAKHGEADPMFVSMGYLKRKFG